MPDLPHISVYLDSNVLFSAAYCERNRLLHFWQLQGVTVVLSPYAMAESRRLARRPDQSARLEALLTRTTIVSDVDARYVPAAIELVPKDRPVLAAAIGASVDFLATGDKKHFSHLYNTRIGGVYIASPADLLDRLDDRIIL